MNLCCRFLFLPFCIFQITESNKVKYFKARDKPGLSAMVELIGSVGDISSLSLIGCVVECYKNDRCLSFFYNRQVHRCVMHSRDFIWQTPRIVDNGWLFYLTDDVSGRCSPPYYFYRHLDFCYYVDTLRGIDFPFIKSLCALKGGGLSPITSQKFQDYFEVLLNVRPYERVCVAGNVGLDGKVRLDNGSLVIYNNWDINEPNRLYDEPCIELKGNNRWHNIKCVMTKPTVYVCEFH